MAPRIPLFPTLLASLLLGCGTAIQVVPDQPDAGSSSKLDSGSPADGTPDLRDGDGLDGPLARDAGAQDGDLDAGKDATSPDATTADATTADATTADAALGDAGAQPDSGVCSPTCVPPTNSCADDSHLTVFSTSAGCPGCVFSSHVESCPFGCSTGACRADPCAQLSCNAPAPACLDSTTLRTAVAQCVNGGCRTTNVDETCAGGCSAGACQPPSCSGQTCDNVPSASCADPKVLVGSAAAGTCTPGGCVYPTVKTWCSQGCLNGSCEAGSWIGELMPPPPGPAGTSWTSIAFAVDGLGRPHIVGADNAGNVTWRHRDDQGWQDVSVDTSLGRGVEVALAVDAGGAPAIAYYEPTNRRLRYAELQGASFHVEAVSASTPAGMHPSIAIARDGQRWIAFNDESAADRGLRVAFGRSGGFSFENLGQNYDGFTQLAFDPAGVLHLAFGARRSFATPSGSYQPPIYHSKRLEGTWRTEQLDPGGLLMKRSMGFTRSGDLLIAYGVVGWAGRNDELRIFQDGAIRSDALAAPLGNWLDVYSPVGLYDGQRDPKFLYGNGTGLVRHDGDFWSPITLELPANPAIIDAVNGPDGEPRFLATLSSNSPANVSGLAFITPPSCVPSCTNASCGSDGCGGTCGACDGSTVCGPDRRCSRWREETINLPRLTNSNGRAALGIALAPNGGHHLLVRYNFPERYYTSGTTQDELFYLTDQHGPWSYPRPALVLGIPSGAYAQAAVIPGSMQVDPTGAPEAVYAYGLSGFTWSVDHAVPSGGGAWVVDGSVTNERISPRLLDIARNEAGVLYSIYVCGYYSDVVCSDRRAGGQNTHSYVRTTRGLAAAAGVDSKGRAHLLISYRTSNDANSGSELAYITDASGSWVRTPLPGQTTTNSSDVFQPRLAVGPGDTVHVLFRDIAGTLQHGVLGPGGFTLEAVDANGSLAIDPAGNPGILVANQGAMTLHRRSSAGWASEPVPVAGSVSMPWLRFDAAGKPHAIFFDSAGSSFQLRLAWRP